LHFQQLPEEVKYAIVSANPLAVRNLLRTAHSTRPPKELILNTLCTIDISWKEIKREIEQLSGAIDAVKSDADAYIALLRSGLVQGWEGDALDEELMRFSIGHYPIIKRNVI